MLRAIAGSLRAARFPILALVAVTALAGVASAQTRHKYRSGQAHAPKAGRGTSRDTSKWNPMNNGHMNNVTTMASNVSVGNGVATLQLAGSSHGAEICTCTGTSSEFTLPVGGVVEASVYFPGDSSHGVYNW